MALLEKVKTACRVTSTAYDEELLDLITAAMADMGITDINPDVLTDSAPAPLIRQAIITYCRMNFGAVDEINYNRLKAAYDEQKSQLLMSSAYSTFGEVTADA